MGPLNGLRVLELVGQGPGPFCGMVLADMGAEVVRVDRRETAEGRADRPPARNPMDRGKRSMAADLKHPDGVDTVLRLLDQSDVLIDPFRPGVLERLGLGPDVCLERNPRLIYGRMTGWGQEGPYAQVPGHDIDYIALAGALEPLGREGQLPTPPINVLGDFAGGAMFLAFGIACAAFARERADDAGGGGQVIDAAMVDGAAVLLTPFFLARASGGWGPRGTNHLDTGAHFYNVYETADGKYIVLGAIEPQFYAALVAKLGLDDEDLSAQWNKSGWRERKQRLAELFLTRTRNEWCELLEHSDTCFAPVLDPVEAPSHPHNVARTTFIDMYGVTQPAPAPRFSRTPATVSRPPSHPGDDTDDVLTDFGFTPEEIARLREAGAIA